MRWSDRSMRCCLPYLTNKLLANSQGRSQINHQSPITPSYEFFVTPNMLNIRFATHRYASLRFASLCFASLSYAPLRSALLRFPLFFLGAGMSNIQLWQFSSKSSSKKSQKPRFYGLSGFLQLGVVFETSIIAHVTPWVHFRRNQSVNLRNTVSEVQKTRFSTVYRVSCSSALCWKLLILPMSLLGSIPS